MNPQATLTTREAALLIGCDVSNVAWLCRHGKLEATPGPGRARGFDWRIDLASAKAWRDRSGPGARRGKRKTVAA